MPTADPHPAAPILAGGFWARMLCVALLAGLGLLTGIRWLAASNATETVIQQSVSPEDFSRDRPELTAPEPEEDR